MKTKLIAFTGYGGSGKDEAAKTLIAAGYQRRCFGDIIKKNLDAKIKAEFGFSAFTEKPNEKKKIRAMLEQWGEDHYQQVFDEFFKDLPEQCVNVRLCRQREAEEWIKRGGVIVAVMRPGVKPETDWSRDRFEELQKAGVIYFYLLNDGKPADLARKVKEFFELSGEALAPKPAAPLPSTPTLANPAAVPSTVAARAETAQNSTQPVEPKEVAPKGEAPGNGSSPKDKEGLDEFVAET